MADSTPPPPRSRTMGAGVGLIGVVGAATLLAILFRGGGGRGTGGTGTGAGAGSGPGPGTPATQSLVATQPARPMKIRIEGTDYVVDGKPMDLAAVTALAAKVPAGEGTAVVVERPGTSRAKAEEDLYAALDKGGIKYVKD